MNVVADFWTDLRYSGRSLRKTPLFVIFVVLTLGLGIGANTTVFTVINTLILNPLPIQNPATLAALATAEAKSRSKSSILLPVSYPNFKDYEARNEVFDSLAAYTSPRPLTFDESGVSERIFCELVTGNYFSTLGLLPAKGRFFFAGRGQHSGRTRSRSSVMPPGKRTSAPRIASSARPCV